MTNAEAIGILAIVVETAKGRCFVTDEAISDAYAMAISALQAQEAKTQLSAEGTTFDLISRQAAIDAECEVCQIAPKKERGHNCTYYVHGCKEIECLRALPSAQPTLYGYNMEHLKLIAEVLRKENLSPERVAEALTDIGRIVSIVRAECEEEFRKAVERCMI